MRFLVTWYDGDNDRVSIVEDNKGKLPFGTLPLDISDDCEHINIIVSVPDDFETDLIVIDDVQVTLS